MLDPCSVYLDSQERTIEVIQGLDREALQTVVPTCPAWSVRDLLAHVTAGVADSVTGDVPELAGVTLMDHWKDAATNEALEALVRRQIEERRDRSVGELVEEWRAATEQALPMLRGERAFPPGIPPLMEWTIAMDVTVHENDLRAAVGLQPADAALPSYGLTATGYGMSLDVRIRELGRPAMRLESDDLVLELGEARLRQCYGPVRSS